MDFAMQTQLILSRLREIPQTLYEKFIGKRLTFGRVFFLN